MTMQREPLSPSIETMPDVRKWASISPCGLYRWDLFRIWKRELGYALFIGLNPSTADANHDDPTIRRCINFAALWGYGGVVMCNLFAYRATEPLHMKMAQEPIGEVNDIVLKCYLSHPAIKTVVAAWGMEGGYLERDRAVCKMATDAGIDLMCLGVTSDGFPRHPLYIRKDTVPVHYKARAVKI